MRCTNAKYVILILLLMVMSNSVVFSQELYQIKGATVIVQLDYGDSVNQLQSRHLHVQLDNNNAEFKSKLEVATLFNTNKGEIQTSIDPTSNANIIEMTGRFKVDHIETSNHAALQFEFSGVLTQNEITLPIYGVAELQHVGGGGAISCMLGYSFEIEEETLRLNNIGGGKLKKVKVQVLQTVLNKDIR